MGAFLLVDDTAVAAILVNCLRQDFRLRGIEFCAASSCGKIVSQRCWRRRT